MPAVALGITALALATRVPAPWQVEATTDEMYHLVSWIRRYRTDDLLPHFQARLASARPLSSPQKALLARLYREHPLVQRLACVKIDASSFGYAALAETIEAMSHSDLVALRVPSAAFSLAAVGLAYLLGRALRDRALGLWMAAFVVSGPVAQVYAGLGRAHILTQAALFLVTYRFVLERQREYRSAWRLLAAALFAQATHVPCWGIVGVLVLSELIRRNRLGESPGTMLQRYWWYALASVVMLAWIAFSSIGGAFFEGNTRRGGFDALWNRWCLGSPFGHLISFGPETLTAAGVVWGVLVAFGVVCLFREGVGLKPYRWPFLAALAVSLLVPMRASAEVRHTLVHGFIPLVLSAIGIRELLRSEVVATVGVGAFTALAAFLSLGTAADPYETVLDGDVRPSAMIDAMESSMHRGDIWIAYPYFAGVTIAQQRPDLEPIMAFDEDDLARLVRDRPSDRATFVLTAGIFAETLPVLRDFERVATFSNRSVLLRAPPNSLDAPSGAEKTPPYRTRRTKSNAGGQGQEPERKP